MKKLSYFIVGAFLAIALTSCGKKNKNRDTAFSTIVPTTTVAPTTVNPTITPTTIKPTTISTIVPSTPVIEELSYEQIIDRNLNGAIIEEAFCNKYKSIGEYNNKNVESNAIYASPNGDGNGTYSSPYSLQDALDEISAGQTLYLLEGIYDSKNADGYDINCKGTADKYITIRNYPGANVKITNSTIGSEAYAMQLSNSCQYLIIEGLEISNITSLCAYGIAIWGNGQNHIIIRNNKIHDIKTNTPNPEKDEENGANAILVLGENKTKPTGNIIFADNEVYNNATGWSESVSFVANVEYIYILNNYVHDNTNIGIDFNGNTGDCSNKEMDQPRYCVAAGNIVERSICGYADCAGLYVDGARNVILQYNKCSESHYGIEIGSEVGKSKPTVNDIKVLNNICNDNLNCGIRIGGYDESVSGSVDNVLVENNEFINNNTEVILAMCNGVTFNNNIFKTNGSLVESDSDISLSKILNIVFTNNKFTIKNEIDLYIELLGKKYNNINDFNNVFGSGNTYIK